MQTCNMLVNKSASDVKDRCSEYCQVNTECEVAHLVLHKYISDLLITDIHSLKIAV